jgi:hypothetical protein
MQQLQARGWRQQGVNRQMRQLPCSSNTALPVLARSAAVKRTQAQFDLITPQQQAATSLLAQPQLPGVQQQPQQQRQAVRCAAAAGSGAAAADARPPIASWKVPAYILLW